MSKAKKIKVDENFLRMLFLLVVLLVVGGIARGSSFLGLASMQNIAVQLVEYGLMALGLSICMISGGIDLSTAYVANFAGIMMGLVIQNMGGGGGIFSALVLGLVIGAACGAFNGFLVSVVHIPAMLATLGSYELFYGIAIVITKGQSVSIAGSGFENFAATKIFGVVPLTFILFLLIAVLISFILDHTSFGRRVHLIGTNDKSSLFSGINVTMNTIVAYMLSGILASIAGIISLSRVTTARADFGKSYVMMTVLIAVLGGCDPNGGKGNIAGVTVAVIVVQCISALLNTIPSLSNYFRELLYGVLLVGVLVLNYYSEKKRSGRV